MMGSCFRSVFLSTVNLDSSMSGHVYSWRAGLMMELFQRLVSAESRNGVLVQLTCLLPSILDDLPKLQLQEPE